MHNGSQSLLCGMRQLWRHHGLGCVIGVLFLATFGFGQIFTGWRSYNERRSENSEAPVTLQQYMRSAHFVEATAENWESEFFQMFVYVYITSFLFQRGSAESNDPDKPRPKRAVTAQSPWPVRRGGLWRALYGRSLSLAFALLFFASFAAHCLSSTQLENEERARHGLGALGVFEHIAGAQFWFESFQNWQSEFLAIGAMVWLSIFLREKNSPESKDLEAPHCETGK